MSDRMVKKTIMNVRIIYLIALMCGGITAEAQFIGNYVEKRISSGAEGNHIFLIDDDYLVDNAGKMPTPYLNNPGITVERSTDNVNYTELNTLKPVQSAAEFNAIWGEDAAQAVIADTLVFNIANETELVSYFQDPNNQFYQLYLFPLKLLKTIGFSYEDKSAKKGVRYYYRLKYVASGKVILEGDVLTGEQNDLLQRYKFNFNQVSIKSIDSLLVGTWVFLENDLRIVNSVEVFGKNTFESEYKLIDKLTPSFRQDTLLASVYHKVNRGEAWQVYVQPLDILGNRGPLSDTATLVSLSAGKLPFVKNFKTKDTTNAVYMSWNKLPAHSYLSGYLLSKTDPENNFSILDTIPLNITEYYDYDIETGVTYNYEIQPIASPVSNFRARDFSPVRASGTHSEIQRVLPPQDFTVTQEGENFRVSWSPVADERLSYYEVLSSTDAVNPTFNTIAIVNQTDTTYLDTLQHGDFNHLTRYYTLKSASYAQKYSETAPPVSITPQLNITVSAPYGLRVRKFKDAVRVSWDQDIASENWVKGYHVYRSFNNGDWESLTSDSLVTVREYLDSNLPSGDYAYRIVGVSLSDEESGFSPVQTLNFKAVSYLDESAFSKVIYRNIPPGIEISWECAINEKPTQVAVYRKGLLATEEFVLLATIPVDEKRYWDKGPKAGETYVYAVEAIFEGVPAAENFDYVRPVMRVPVGEN